MEKINIVFCTDTNYIMPSGVLMKSISANNASHAIDFYAIVDESVTDHDRQALAGVIADNSQHSISFLRVCGKDYENMPNLDVSEEYARKNKVTATHTTKACYYRLSMADLLPPDVKRVLYFDCDIVVTQDLMPLWLTDLEGKAVAAVKDEGEPEMSYDQLGYSPEFGYFNSGAMIIDIDYWRKNAMFDQFLKIIREHAGRMRQHDQEILNIAFYDNVKLLPLKYNLQEHFLRKANHGNQFYQKYGQQIEDAVNDYAVIHFTADKPWFRECHQPLTDQFDHYLKLTQWHGLKKRWKRPQFKRNILIHRWLTKLGIFKSAYRKL